MPIDYDAPLEPINTGKKRKSKVPTAKDLEKALATLKSLGFSVNLPTSTQEQDRQIASLSKLGFEEEVQVKKTKPKKGEVEKLRATLYCTHVIGGITYGPGLIELTIDERDLFRSLVQQDQAAIRSVQDTKEYNPISRCYLIKPGNGRDQHNKYRKQEVSAAVFNSEQAFLSEDAAVTAGQYDIAGYHPNSQPQSF